MLKHASTLIAAAAFLFSLFRSPVRTLAIAALLGALWWYYDAHAGEIHQLTNQVSAVSQAAVTSHKPVPVDTTLLRRTTRPGASDGPDGDKQE